MALADFMKGGYSFITYTEALLNLGQNYWAFDLVLVVGDGYLEGLEDFMRSYHVLFSGIVWTGLNIDYPGHSFSHLGLFYGASPVIPFQHRILLY
jgi:glycosylphosphatidylinositol transamidase